MPRPFFGSGFFPVSTPPPEAYLALVDAFGGDTAAANAWLDGWIAYAGDGATLVQILDAVEAGGTPADFLAARPLTVALDFQGAGVAPGFVWDAVEVPDAILTVEVATDYP